MKKDQQEVQSDEFKVKYEIVEFYKPTKQVLKIFGDEKNLLNDYFTFEQVKEYVNKYIQKNCPQDKNKKTIYKVDDFLLALMPEEEQEPEEEVKVEPVGSDDEDDAQ